LTERWRVWGPAAAWAVLLFLLSSIPGGVGGLALPISDKLVHAALYAVLGSALAFGRARSPMVVPHLVLLCLGALYGVTDEVHQAFVPGRSPDIADWIADVVGLVTGYGTTVAILGRTNHRVDFEESP